MICGAFSRHFLSTPPPKQTKPPNVVASIVEKMTMALMIPKMKCFDVRGETGQGRIYGGLGCVGIKAYAGMEASSRMNERNKEPALEDK
jgi:hypothetical protein